jgi:thiosulfate/3-mercaptopyruvate sulfurtransferase
LPEPDTLVTLFASWGVTRQARVVAYDEAGGALAARLWWLLRWMGHAGVSLLDGGLPAWTRAGLPLATEPPVARTAPFTGSSGHMPVITTAELEARLADASLTLIDARARPRFLGIEEPLDPVAGHVPGAVNVPFQRNLAADGRFRPPAELRDEFARAAQGRSADGLAVMCGSGVTACHDLFAMELAGLPGAALYAGSWSEWIRSPRRPIETGESTGETE